MIEATPSLTVADRKPRLWMVDELFESDGPLLPRVRRAFFFKSGPAVFADIGSDFLVWYRRFLFRKHVLRVFLVGLGFAIAVAVHGDGWSSRATIVPLAWAFWISPLFAAFIAIPVAIFLGHYWWLPFAGVMMAALHRRAVEPAREVALGLGGWQPVQLLPARESLILVFRRARFAFANAADLAVAGLPERSAINASTVTPKLDERTPSARAMLTATEALIAFQQGDHAESLRLCELARQQSTKAAAAPRSWVLLIVARLLANLGDTAVASHLSDEAAAIVPANAKALRFEAEIQRSRLGSAHGDGSARLRSLHTARLLSLSQRSMVGLILTELALLETGGAPLDSKREVLQWLVSFARADYKNAVPIPRDVVGSIEAFAAEVAIADGEWRNAADHFARAASAFGEGHNPVQKGLVATRFADLLSSTTSEPLADGLTVEDQQRDALAIAIEAVADLNAVRYALPTAQWRQAWARARSHSYDLALRLAIRAEAFDLAAGLVELSKAQGVPLQRTGAAPLGWELLDSLLAARAQLVDSSGPVNVSTDGDAAAIEALLPSAHPLEAGINPIVAGKRVLEGESDDGFDVDHAVRTVGGSNAFYLSAVMTGEDYYWALRAPNGRWSAGHVEFAIDTDANEALAALFAALPIRGARESERQYLMRVARSPLFGAPDNSARRREKELLQGAGQVLIPAELVRSLRRSFMTTGYRPRLIVSMPGVLSGIPVAFLGIGSDESGDSGDQRLVELADITSLPSLQLGARIASRRRAREPERWPLEFAGAFPTPGAEHVTAPPWASNVVDTKLAALKRKDALHTALLALAERRDSTTGYLSGHLVPASIRGFVDPQQSGLQLSEGRMTDQSAFLTVKDLLGGGELGDFIMPTRLLLLACSTTGVIESTDNGPGASRWPLSGEWTGFGAACLAAGARTIICTHFDQLDSDETTALDHQIARMLENVDDPVRGLSAIQRQNIAAWRAGQATHPAITAMPYTIVACYGSGVAAADEFVEASSKETTASTNSRSGSLASISTLDSAVSTRSVKVKWSSSDERESPLMRRRANFESSPRATRS